MSRKFLFNMPLTSMQRDRAGPMSRKDTVLTRSQIEGLIADGRTVIIVDGKVLKLDAWLKFHPGGDKAIMHMVGRDATDEVNAYAFPTTSEKEIH